MKDEDVKDSIPEEEMRKEGDEGGKEDALLLRIKELEEEIKALREEDLRNRAETENYRKRLLKDKESAVTFANEALIKDLLDPVDNFSRAIDSANKSEDFKALKDGIEMVEDQLLSTLKTNWGLEVIDAMDKPFDPAVMEAYAVEEREDITEEKVISVFQSGYTLHGKVIRTAKVMVAKPRNA